MEKLFCYVNPSPFRYNCFKYGIINKEDVPLHEAKGHFVREEHTKPLIISMNA